MCDAQCLPDALFVNSLGDGLSVDSLSVQRAAELRALEVPELFDFSEPGFHAIVSRMAEIFQSTVCAVEYADRAWRLCARSEHPRAAPAGESLAKLLHGTSRSGPDIRLALDAAGDAWTLVPIAAAARCRHALIVAGDWRLSSPAIRDMVLKIEASMRRPPSGTASRRARARAFGHRLTRTFGMRPVCEAILAAFARLVDARLGCIAVAEENQKQLAIRATCGYPHLLVEHLRFEPGEGIIGQVFQTGTRIVHSSGDILEGRRRRPRYRSDSFIALPLRSAGEVIAVVCLADPVGREAFDALDLVRLNSLTAPAALALARERALARAETYAHAAAIDPVSGLFNRRYFHIRIQEELQRSRRHQIPVALLMIDLDDFKRVNDSYGHLIGDLIIRETAEILRRSVRVFDVCTRFGGEEFAIIMPGSGPESAGVVAERIRDRVAAHRFSDPELAGLSMTVSIGLAVSTDGVTARELVSRADQALYFAKRAGKNRVHTFEGNNKHT